jgi:hypothetical protein
MTFDSNFFIIFILIFVLLYFSSLTNEKFQSKNQNNIKCSDIEAISIDSDRNNSSFCPSYCKLSLTQDGKSVYCVDNK